MNRTKVRHILRQNRKHRATKDIARDIKVSRSRSHVSDGAKDWPEDVKMQKRWKLVRYERKHSPAEHIDWNEQNEINIKVCVILDDASRTGWRLYIEQIDIHRCGGWDSNRVLQVMLIYLESHFHIG